MIVEDEDMHVADIKDHLANFGRYTVIAVASSGEEAMAKATANPPDVILMDIVLKGEMDGIETAKIIHSRFNIPVIYLTAYSDEERLTRAIATEPFGYILKPFQERELLAVIEMALYKHRVEEERIKLLNDLKAAKAHVKTLTGLLPICASCKRVRDDHGYWQRIEAYIEEHSDADFTHSVCPECTNKFFKQ